MINLIIIGAPGTGKTTQAQLLSVDDGYKTFKNSLGLIPVNSGNLINKEINSESSLGEHLNEILMNGQEIPNAYVSELVMNEVCNYGQGNWCAGFIFDAYPKTLEQAQFLNKYNIPSNNSGILAVINLELDNQTCIDRLLNRDQRPKDKNVKLIKSRLKKYTQDSQPILEYFKDIVITVDASGTREEVNEKINNALTGKQE